MPPRPPHAWLAKVAACLGVAVAAPALGWTLGWLDSRAYLGCPESARGWIAGEHACRSFLTVSAHLAAAEILLAVGVFLLSRWAGWRRLGPWLAMVPLAWLAIGGWGLYREAADQVAPGTADKVEFLGRWDRPLAWVAGGILGLGVAVFWWRARARRGG